MSSPAQVAAAIANSQASTGPSSAAGKETVSKNALVHGLASSNPAHPALPGEEAAYAAHLDSYRQTYAPANQPEEYLVRALAAAHWRLDRANQLERALFKMVLQHDDFKGLDPADAQALAWSNKDTGLQRIALYAHRIQRTAEKTAAALETLQQQRKAAFAKAQEEAMLLLQLSITEGQNFDPAIHFGPPERHGGFVYSLPETQLALLRILRLEAAQSCLKQAA